MTPAQIGSYWRQAGGSDGTVDEAVAVALAESSGTPNAVSPTGAYGLWQIELSVHIGTGGISWTNWSTPLVNARAAVAISAGGSNWAAWTTAWFGGHRGPTPVLPVLQPTSPAAKREATVAGATAAFAGTAATLGAGGGTGMVQGPGLTPLFDTWSQMQWDAGPNANVQTQRAYAAMDAMNVIG